MPAPVVWTERNTGSVGWTDCTWCSILMVVVGSGYTRFPLGIYTEPERKAFRGSDPRLNFAGGVEKAKARYGVTVVSPAPMSATQLRAALTIPNRVWAIAGKLVNFPSGHRLRRWQPQFVDFHAVAVASDSAARLTWLDPLAPNRHAGDPVTVAEVELFGKGNYPNDARYMTMGGASGGADVPLIPTAQFSHIFNKKTSLKAQTALKAEPLSTSATLRTYASGTGFFPVVKANPPGGGWYGCWLYDDAPAGYTYGYFPVSASNPLTDNENPPDAAPPPADCDAAVAEALTKRDQQWQASILEALHPEE